MDSSNNGNPGSNTNDSVNGNPVISATAPIPRKKQPTMDITGTIPRRSLPTAAGRSNPNSMAPPPMSRPLVSATTKASTTLPPIPKRPKLPFSGASRSKVAVGGAAATSTTSSSKPRPKPKKPRAPKLTMGRRPLPTSRTDGRVVTANNSHSASPIQIESEFPFVLKISLQDIPYYGRSSERAPKRKRPTYQELEDTDSDDFLTSSDEDDAPKKPKPKSSAQEELLAASSGIPTGDVVVQPAADVVEAPPPGVLANLWYSREQVLHVFSMERIIGWKKRNVTRLEFSEQYDVKALNPAEATPITLKALANEGLWRDQHKRMEVSRIHSAECPIVMHLCAQKEAHAAGIQGREPRYKIATRAPSQEEGEQEEVLLVKWRGRSYSHCSWERQCDLEKYDANSNTARGKIRRYYQSQHINYGPNWKEVVAAERSNDAVHEEEMIPPQYLEVERLLACDESEMNYEIFAKQRTLNLRAEQEALKRRDKEEQEGILHKNTGLFEGLPLVTDGDDPWDPEDYVRYVVKWKGMQYSECTWEYWINIKRDAVDVAEDFWDRQKTPNPDDIRKLPPHPHMQQFRKLTESPAFGISKRRRPVADLGGGFKMEEDDEKEAREFKLRSYQLEGVNWLLFNWWNKRSCILADEMGLGKTIQSTGFLHQLHCLPQTQVRGPFLVVAPLSLIGQWQSECHTWTPDLNVVFYHGSADARDFLSQQEFFYTEQFASKQTATKLKKLHVTKFHILITTYEVVLKDIEVLKKIRWKALIVDEAHRLKNPKSRLFAELASVPREFCLLLTGTPLQNSTEELWALLHFADPVTFKSKDDFVEKFGELSDSKQVSELHATIKPYLLRRVKEDVEKSLPPKEETILEVTLTPTQKTYYKAIYEKNTAFLFKGAKPSNAPSLMNVMMELRKACNHPFLIRGAEERIINEAIAAAKGQTDGDGDETMLEPFKMFGEQLIKSSGKFVLLAKLLPKLFTGGHKVLIFSQMVRVLDLLEELVKWKKYRYERLDGSTTATSRAAAVDRFCRKSCQRFVMLLSTRAGGLGLNLTAADTVIIFDSDWNPQNDLQAMARSHRIGQTRPVRVYRLLTAKTYEMHMFHSASMKLGLDRAVLAAQRGQGEEAAGGDGKSQKSDKETQAKEIDELLKKGAYDVFRDDDDKEAKKFMETDIDQLLEQSSKKVTYGTANSSISSGLGSFSKASFVADTGDGAKDVDLDDPDFWEKAVGLDVPVETPEEIAQMIDDGVKRSRKQVIQYDPYAELFEAEEKKKTKVAHKAKQDKEEKERIRMEKRNKKLEEKEKKKKKPKLEEDENDAGDDSSMDEEEIAILMAVEEEEKQKEREKLAREQSKPKKLKKSERSKAQRRAEFEDPTLERLRQAWDAQQRSKASASFIRFGFDRFCKLRNDSNLNSLPLQDLEVFVRSYVFQLGLQVAVSIMKLLHQKIDQPKALSEIAEGDLRAVVGYWIGRNAEQEISWICESVCCAASMYLQVASSKRMLRMPLSLADADFVSEMRKGPALRALRRVGILDRLNHVMSTIINDLVMKLGQEEIGRRGCLVKDYSMLDADLKCRHITFEELSLALGARLEFPDERNRTPAAWWDRTCDVALLVGTFVHGFGNYEAMRSDEELPFAKLIERCANEDQGSTVAAKLFVAATAQARLIFDAALESSKAKAQLEAHAAVAAAVAATKKAQAEGGTDEPIKNATDGVTEAVNSLDTEADDLHMVTLPRMNRKIGIRLRKCHRGEPVDDIDMSLKPSESLPMPDPRVLDSRLAELVELLETGSASITVWSQPESTLLQEIPESVATTDSILDKSCRRLALSKEVMGREFRGLGLSGNQCGAAHRNLDDGSDYAVGSASAALNFVATGNDGPRYLRALGVPINITRYAITACVHADMKMVEKMLANEQDRNFPKKEEKATQHLGDEAEKDTQEEKKDEAKSDTISNGIVAPQDNTAPISSAANVKQEESNIAVEKIPQVVPQEIIPATIKDQSKLRASICAVALHFGCPIRTKDTSIDDSIVQTLQQYTPYSEAVSSLYNFPDFCKKVKSLSGMEEDLQPSMLHDYVESVLLPHCLRLAVYGNGTTTRHTRVSKGKFETAHGHSLYPEPFESAQTPLPDPTCAASQHSIEAVLNAGAIVRRVRLIRAAQFAVGGAVSLEELQTIFSSELLCRSMDGLPMWWNPSIHDLALLVSVASGGVFSLLLNRQGTVFDKSSEVVVAQVKRLGGDIASAGDDNVRQWVKDQCSSLPTPNVLERRLALLCAEATKHLDNETTYFHLPMFDHGGWPRN